MFKFLRSNLRTCTMKFYQVSNLFFSKMSKFKFIYFKISKFKSTFSKFSTQWLVRDSKPASNRLGLLNAIDHTKIEMAGKKIKIKNFTGHSFRISRTSGHSGLYIYLFIGNMKKGPLLFIMPKLAQKHIFKWWFWHFTCLSNWARIS